MAGVQRRGRSKPNVAKRLFLGDRKIKFKTEIGKKDNSFSPSKRISGAVALEYLKTMGFPKT